MAANTSNKRIPVKFVRDRAKAGYEKKAACYICGTSESLELHHTHSITLLLNNWVELKGYDVSTDEKIIAVRDEFIRDHNKEIYEAVFTLCNKHHVKLHQVYGKAPALTTAGKQAVWIEKQKQKAEGLVDEEVIESLKPVTHSSLSTFSRFY